MHDRSDVLRGRRVLIVEDEMLIAMELEALITEAGCMVCGPALSVGQALTLLNCTQPDVAILDANLNGEDAAPIAAALSARGVPFVIVTGYAAAHMNAELQHLPRLDKPVDHARLICTLAKILDTCSA